MFYRSWPDCRLLIESYLWQNILLQVVSKNLYHIFREVCNYVTLVLQDDFHSCCYRDSYLNPKNYGNKSGKRRRYFSCLENLDRPPEALGKVWKSKLKNPQKRLEFFEKDYGE